jgi:cytochrome c peroxidase
MAADAKPGWWPCGLAATLMAVMSAISFAPRALSQAAEEPPPLVSLKSVPVPGPGDAVLRTMVQDREAALQLGKALFWDMRVGSDNRTACATCHFHAGADARVKNQVSPGLLAGDTAFSVGRGPNHTLTLQDFPLTRFASLEPGAAIVRDSNDVISSQGVFTAAFNSVSRRGGADDCSELSDAVSHGGTGFNLNGVNTRRVEPRNAPSVFNAVFNFRNFWDGRANNSFNGVDPFGLRNANARIWRVEQGVLRELATALPSASLMSLSSGPPLSENEMSCRGRTFADLARKLIEQPILADQEIDHSDSVLGPLAGRRPTYGELVRRAFVAEYWSSDRSVMLPPNNVAQPTGKEDLPRSRHRGGHARHERPDRASQLEANFALFFGVAVHLYQSSLVSDETPFDRFAEGQKSALNAAQQRGLAIFNGAKAQCVHCHGGPEFTSASHANVLTEGRLDQRAGADNSVFRYDNGFFNTGVRPSAEDIGVAGVDPFGMSFSETRLAAQHRFELFGNGFDIANEVPVATDAPLAIDGAFKTPGLRNVELTGPYFHNGGKATLLQVIDAYNRGGDFGARNQPVPDPTIRPLGLTETEKSDLVSFLLALTDERVRWQRAPFDHPSICVPHGHVGNDQRIERDERNARGQARDEMMCIEAVGARGARHPLQPFLAADHFKR